MRQLFSFALISALCFPMLCIAQDCTQEAEKGAKGGAQEIEAERDFHIPESISGPIIKEIAVAVCSPAATAKGEKVNEVARLVARKYFESANELGRPSEIKAILTSVLTGKQGLGRPDWRSFGALTITCPSDADAEIKGVGVVECGGRYLLTPGSISIKVTQKLKAICASTADIKMSVEKKCKCLGSAGSGGVYQLTCEDSAE